MSATAARATTAATKAPPTPILAAVLVAEIGEVTRFDRPEQLASWAGLTPRHHESDTTVHRGKITKQGSRLVRWAAVIARLDLPIPPSPTIVTTRQWSSTTHSCSVASSRSRPYSVGTVIASPQSINAAC